MRKISKVKLTNIILDNKELSLLKGGKRNKNIYEDCKCTYYDAPSVSNTNKVGGCSCECVF